VRGAMRWAIDATHPQAGVSGSSMSPRQPRQSRRAVQQALLRTAPATTPQTRPLASPLRAVSLQENHIGYSPSVPPQKTRDWTENAKRQMPALRVAELQCSVSHIFTWFQNSRYQRFLTERCPADAHLACCPSNVRPETLQNNMGSQAPVFLLKMNMNMANASATKLENVKPPANSRSRPSIPQTTSSRRREHISAPWPESRKTRPALLRVVGGRECLQPNGKPGRHEGYTNQLVPAGVWIGRNRDGCASAGEHT
jgi:hypothetical protein